jgi:TolB protein
MRTALSLLTVIGLAACDGTGPADDLVLRDRIVFVVDTGRYRLLHMRPDGSDLRAIPVELPGHAFDPDVSPDGRRIALSVAITSHNVYVVNADGTGLKNLTPASASRIAPDWSPDGERIAYSTGFATNDPDVIVMNADGSGAHAIAQTPFHETRPAWSPDGRTIAFASDRAEPGNEDIYLLSLTDSSITRLTDTEGDDYQAEWSPNGGTIAFVSSRDLAPQLFLMGSNGSMQRPLFAMQLLGPTQPHWSGNGDRIVFQCDLGNICVANVDGTAATTVAPGRDPTWAR